MGSHIHGAGSRPVRRAKVCKKNKLVKLRTMISPISVGRELYHDHVLIARGFWDPLGFTADGDVAAFRRRRSVELKHGRISMLATMGYITPEVAGKFPGFLSPSAGHGEA